jgi:hypothetical protein
VAVILYEKKEQKLLSNLLTRYNLEAFATNKQGDAVNLGEPATVKQYKSGEKVTWKVDGDATHVSNLDTVVFYDGNKIIGSMPVTPFRAENVTEVTLYVK